MWRLRRGLRQWTAAGRAGFAVLGALIACYLLAASRWPLGFSSTAAPFGVAKVDDAEAAALAAAWRQVDSLTDQVNRRGVLPDFGSQAAALVRQGLTAAGAVAGGSFEQVLDAPLEALFRQQLQTLLVRAVDRYEQEMDARPNPLEAARKAEELFLEGAKKLVRPGSTWSFEAEHQDLLNSLSANYGRDNQLVAEQAEKGQGKQITIEVIRTLQQQAAAVQQEVETRGAFPWNVRWQYMIENSPVGFRGQYSQGRSIVELLLMPNPDPRQKKNWLNRLGPLNLAVAFDMLM